MEVDFDTCLRSLRNSFNQYRNYPSEDSRKDLEREINVIVGIASHGERNISSRFNPRNLLHADALSIFVTLMNEVNLKESIFAASISLLNELAASSKIRLSLQETFKLPSTLFNFIIQHQTSSDLSIILQCLQLVQLVTYGIKVQHSLGDLDGLIKYLVSKVMAPESVLTTHCLGSLTNLCRNNFLVQDHLKKLGNVKGFFRSVASFLSHSNWMNIIYALSILSICIDEPLGEKVFNKNNIDQTFALTFNVLLKGKSVNMQKYACDLLNDLMQSTRMQKYLANYTDLQIHMKELALKLKAVDEELVEKILQLLISMKNIHGLLEKLYFGYDVNGPEKAGSENCGDKDSANSCMSVVLELCGRLLAKRNPLASLALRFLKHLYQANSPSIQSSSKVIRMLARHLHLLEEEENYPSVQERYENIRRSIEILMIFCCEETLTSAVTESISCGSICRFIEIIFDRFATELSSPRSISCEHREEVSSAVIAFIELMSLVIKYTRQGQEAYTQILQSSNLPPFLACCLASTSTDLVKRTMKIVQTLLSLSKYSPDLLSTLLASNNKQREEITALLRKKQSIEPPYHPNVTSFPVNEIASNSRRDGGKSKHEEHVDSISALAERVSSGLEIKDSAKVSEIMDIYEHKLAIIQGKESHLQDLLDAKTAALAQADRYIAQYRCRSAQSEAECLKLRSLLLESQKTSESQLEQINVFTEEMKSLETKIDSLSDENKALCEISTEHHQLKLSHKEALDRLNTVRNGLIAAEEEQKNVTETNEILKKQYENLKSQQESSLLQLRKCEEEKQSTIKTLHEKESKLDDAIKKMIQFDERIKNQNQELQEWERKMKQAEAKLKILEKANGGLSGKVEELEKEKTNLLGVIEELEKQKLNHQEHMKRIVQQVKELEKERQILSQRLCELEKKNEESLKSISALKREVKERDNDNKEVEKKMKDVEKKLKQTEKSKMDLNHKVSSLGVLNEKYEKDISKKDELIKELKQQLDKHSQIAAMIHNLSSGKVPCNGLNFSP